MQQFLDELLPKGPLTLYFAKDCKLEKIEQSVLKELKKHDQWCINKCDERLSDLHDRYIIVDNEIIIILTSGIYYLMSDEKDFTYILRKY